MHEEIRQQPEALQRTLESGLRLAARLRRRFEKARPRFIVLAARGTSDNAAQFGRYLLEITTGIPVSMAAPSVFTLYRSALDLHGGLVVTVSQSGESTDIAYVLEYARSRGALTAGITNEPSSTMARLAEHTFLVRAGKEKSVAATKTYTGQVLCFYLLAQALGARMKLDDLRRLPEWTATALTLEKEIAAAAERYRFMTHAAVVGRGLNYANAFEFALKMMETCYVVAERFSVSDFLHGHIAIIEPSCPVFLFAPSGVTWPGTREMLARLEHLKADTLLITDRSNREACKAARRAIVVPLRLSGASAHPVELYTPIPYIVPAQLFAASLAADKGIDPDHPRSLSKVTRTL